MIATPKQARTAARGVVALPGEAAPRRVFSVSLVVGRADQVLQEKAPPLWVRGEVSGWKRISSGHCYFTLKDDRAELCCTLWANAARQLPALPENGMEVEAFGQLGIYTRRGQFRLDVTRLEKTGAGGLWELARERLLAQLRREGLLDEARKRTLPPYPARVGIVTSTQSAAFHDMRRALRRKAWWIPVLVSPCGVEGVDVAPEIAAAIRRFGSRRERCPVDVVIVARGGGSMESLWAFNTEPVARAIAECPVPVISAVGHETDYTVADQVADWRSATPTAGAERAVPEGQEILSALAELPAELHGRLARALDLQAERLRGSREGVDRSMARRLQWIRSGLDAAERHLGAHSPRRALQGAAEQVERSTGELHRAMQRRLDRLDQQASAGTVALHESAGQRLNLLEREFVAAVEALEARSPLRVLARGYAVVSDPETGHVVRDAADVKPDQRLQLRLARGEIIVRAESTRAEPQQGATA